MPTGYEQAILEAAVDWHYWRQASQYGPAQEQMRKAEQVLERAVSDAHDEHDGKYCP